MHSPRLKSLEACAEATRGAFGFEERDPAPVAARRGASRVIIWMALAGIAALAAAYQAGWAGMVATLNFFSGSA